MNMVYNNKLIKKIDLVKFLLLMMMCFCVGVMKTTGQKSTNGFVDQELMIQVPQSHLYVRVRGVPEKPLLINLHGGPGGYSGIDIPLMGPYLESDYLIAYLDQRGCGKSLACNDQSLLTVEQYINDLDIVIDSLLHRYRKTGVNLIGTSWGGMYGFLYILEQPGKVKAYACIDGKVNSEYQNNALIELELEMASQQLKEAQSESQKQKLNYIIDELERIKRSDFDQFHKDVNWMKHEVPKILGFNAYFADTSKIISVKKVLQDTALLSLMNYTKEEYLGIGTRAETVNEAFRNNRDYNTLNIENDLAQIKTPAIVVQGEKDFVVGKGHARLIYDALKNLSPNEKELHIIPDVGHCPAIEAPEKLFQLVDDFFEKYN